MIKDIIDYIKELPKLLLVFLGVVVWGCPISLAILSVIYLFNRIIGAEDLISDAPRMDAMLIIIGIIVVLFLLYQLLHHYSKGYHKGNPSSVRNIILAEITVAITLLSVWGIFCIPNNLIKAMGFGYVLLIIIGLPIIIIIGYLSLSSILSKE